MEKAGSRVCPRVFHSFDDSVGAPSVVALLSHGAERSSKPAFPRLVAGHGRCAGGSARTRVGQPGMKPGMVPLRIGEPGGWVAAQVSSTSTAVRVRHNLTPVRAAEALRRR